MQDMFECINVELSIAMTLVSLMTLQAVLTVIIIL